MPVRVDLRREGHGGGRQMPGDRLASRPGKATPVRDHRGADHDEHACECARGDEAAEPTHQSHGAITGTPVALLASFSNCTGSVVNSPSRMALFAPW